MKIEICQSYQELSQKACDVILYELKWKNNLMLCAATGNSPTGAYELLGEEYRDQPEIFEELQVMKLDEWGGIAMEHPGTCESYLQGHLIKPLEIDQSRYFGFNSSPMDSQQECLTMQNILEKKGPIDLCVLGLGMNGHLAFNEPADFLQPHAHVSNLSPSSLQHSMASEMSIKPSYGLTLGMADIMQSKMILMLISGPQKINIVNDFLSKKITTLLPASFLWLHSNVICLIEKECIG